ncbi:MAG: hypothetical protein AVDCRST_MAG88-1505, partial [uncultured Thermomicrobiales bacterium]
GGGNRGDDRERFGHAERPDQPLIPQERDVAEVGQAAEDDERAERDEHI